MLISITEYEYDIMCKGAVCRREDMLTVFKLHLIVLHKECEIASFKKLKAL